VADQIDTRIGAENVAAVLVEPIQGEGGFIVPAAGFLPRLREYCQDRGILFIADEVQTGFARTGDMFASEHENLVPDLITTAKGIAGGCHWAPLPAAPTCWTRCRLAAWEEPTPGIRWPVRLRWVCSRRSSGTTSLPAREASVG
jgi:4-aminobutyrate aminotransferase/(S)-3-amino-2-methylpropionate transaminase